MNFSVFSHNNKIKTLILDIPFEVQPSVEFFKELIKPEGKKALLEIYRKYGENLKESLKYIYNVILQLKFILNLYKENA